MDVSVDTFVAQPICFEPRSQYDHARVVGDISPTLKRMAGGQSEPCVIQPFGVGEQPDVAHCLRSGASKADKHESTTYVAQSVAYTTKLHNTQSNQAGKVYKEYSTSLDANSPPPAVFQPITFSSVQSNQSINAELDVSQTLESRNPMAVAVGTDCYNGNITGDVACTMGTPGSSVNASGPTVMQGMAVRRLTPVECERLQGFPDDYTAIPWRKGNDTPDGPRYKALGNSMAVPVMSWIGKRIQEYMNESNHPGH